MREPAWMCWWTRVVAACMPANISAAWVSSAARKARASAGSPRPRRTRTWERVWLMFSSCLSLRTARGSQGGTTRRLVGGSARGGAAGCGACSARTSCDTPATVGAGPDGKGRSRPSARGRSGGERDPCPLHEPLRGVEDDVGLDSLHGVARSCPGRGLLGVARLILVPLVAVDLDDEAEVWPDVVGLEGAYFHVYLRQLDAVFVEQLQASCLGV